MTTQLDIALGFKKESVFGTYAAPDKFPEIISEDLKWEPEFSDGSAQRSGRRMKRGDRRVLGKESVSGMTEHELGTKGFGALFEAALGTAVSNLISGSAYQQLITPATTDPLSCYSIQKGIPLVGGGAAQALSFVGMVCTGFELSAKNGAVPTVKFNWLGKGVDVGQAFATPSYPAAYELFSFVGGTIRAAGGTFGGTVTPPGTITLASGGTALGDILEIDMEWDNGTDEGGFFLGGSGKRGRKPALGERGLTGTFSAEYDTTALQAAFLAQSDLSLVLQFQHSSIISGALKPTIEFTIPLLRLDGELPTASTPGEVVTQSIDFTALEGSATHPFYIAIITAETAIG